MRLSHLRLDNFQGIPALDIDLAGKDANIYGNNGTGKTTIFNAITWLLFDKPSTGAKNWSPKTRGANGEVHNMEHSAVGTFTMDDGRIVTLGKTLREVYKKKRGSATTEYTGNTVDYFLDGVPVKEKEYTAAVSGYFGDDEMMKLLTMPYYFPEVMEWKKRREMLLEICGDVTDDAVIDGDPDLADLRTYLLIPGTVGQYYSVEEFSKIAKARKTDINKQLEVLPDRIDEAKRAITADLPERSAIEESVRKASADAEKQRAKIATIQVSGDTTARTALAKARAELTEAEANHRAAQAEAQAADRAAIADIDREIRDIRREAEDARAEAETKRRYMARLQNLRDSILAEWHSAQAETWDPNRETCPTCGRRLPEDKIEEMCGDFNQRKSERLESINERGRREASKDMIEAAGTEIAALEEKAAEAEKRAAETEKKRDGVAAAMGTPAPFSATPEYAELQSRITLLSERAAIADSANTEAVEAADAELQRILSEEHRLRGVLLQIDTAEKQRARVAELEAQEKKLAEEYENTERGVYLCELFTRSKVSALTSRINSKFRNVSFQLFTEQVNGGLNECCEVLVPCDGAMVPYATANHAARVNAGLEIIETVAEHFGKHMPVVVDNAESVTQLTAMSGQLIRLVVSEADKGLRVEVA